MLNVYIEKEGAKHDTLLRWQSSCAFSTVNDCRYEKMNLQSEGNLNDHIITPWWQRCIAISNAVLYHFLETCKLVKFSSGDMCLHLCGAYLASGRLELWGSMEHFLDLQGLCIVFFLTFIRAGLRHLLQVSLGFQLDHSKFPPQTFATSFTKKVPHDRYVWVRLT